jgi:hypothetical protein
MPQSRTYNSRIPEDHPFALYALWQRDDDRTDVQPGDVETYDIRIYDDLDTLIWERLLEDPVGVFFTRQTGIPAAPGGWNFKLQIPLGALDDDADALVTVGGRSITVIVTVHSALLDLEGSRTVWQLEIDSAPGT